MYAPREERNPEQRTFTMTLYMLTAFAGALQALNSVFALTLSVLFITLCLFMTRAQKLTARGTTYESHVEFTRRTLSIGTFILLPLSLCVASYLVWNSIDFPAIKKQIRDSGGDIGSTITIVKTYADDNMDRVQSITTRSIAPVIFWWLRRCYSGFMKANRSEPIFYPEGLL